MRRQPLSAVAIVIAFTLWASAPALALKPWTLVEDGYPEATGQLELETSFETTWHTQEDHDFREFDLENELEYGVNEHFAIRAKMTNVYEDSQDFEGLHFDAAGVEAQYYFTDPNTAPLGISLIGSLEAGERGLFAGEAFLVLQKDFEHFIFAYNLGLFTEVESAFTGGDDAETTGTWANSLGALYSFNPQVRAGVEIASESSYEEWRKYAGTTVYAGPVLNITPADNLWITVGVDMLIGNQEDEPRYRAALIVGYYF